MAKKPDDDRNDHGLTDQNVKNTLLFRAAVHHCKGKLPTSENVSQFEKELGCKKDDLAENIKQGFHCTCSLLFSKQEILDKALKLETPDGMLPEKRLEVALFRAMVHHYGGKFPKKEQVDSYAKLLGGESNPECIVTALGNGMLANAEMAMNDPEILEQAINLPIC